MNKYISNNIADIALTVYKNMQNKKSININSLVSATVLSLGVDLIKKNLSGQSMNNLNSKKIFIIGGLIFLGLNSSSRSNL